MRSIQIAAKMELRGVSTENLSQLVQYRKSNNIDQDNDIIQLNKKAQILINSEDLCFKFFYFSA